MPGRPRGGPAWWAALSVPASSAEVAAAQDQQPAAHMICADTGQWGPAAERFAVAAAAEVSARYDRGASVSQASLLWALAHARDWNVAETVLLRDVLPRRGQAVSARAARLLMTAARLRDDARGRPSLCQASRELTISP
ncbi:hypothetical protein ACTMTF_41430 [Nonomuraea sp. ZG12]|uniref:hypothetical protein n=1 Tax=Nonomuraea sp. ZG12 TaxID=3452207 RepID=UPI003F8970C5